jgi:acyl-CoA synthetase (AMP-forming)/AMP-acid ligase II
VANFAQWLIQSGGSNVKLEDVVSGMSVTDITASIASIAYQLRTQGVRKSDFVVVGADRQLLSGLVYLATLYCGAIAIPVAKENLWDTLKKIEPALVWLPNQKWLKASNPECQPEYPIVIGQACIGTGTMQSVQVEQDDLAALFATSGSTDVSKLVMISHANLQANTLAIVSTQKLQRDDKALICMPLSYCFALSVFHSHIACGASVVFDSRFMFSQKVVNTLIDKHCTTFAGVPMMYQALANNTTILQTPSPQLKRFIQAGGKLDSQTIDRFIQSFPNTDFYVMYGQTEATARITTLPPELYESKKGSVGLPLPGLQVKTNEAGEVLVKGASVSSGYWNNTQDTAKKWQDGWLNTSDIGRLDEDGVLWLTGRNQNFIKLRGVRVSFDEIESRLLALPGVSATTVIFEQDQLHLLLQSTLDYDNSALRKALPAVWWPFNVHVMANFPLNVHGKIDKQKLTEDLI